MKYFTYIILVLFTLVSWNVCALRDPFLYRVGHRYVCVGIGTIDTSLFFAQIYKDGLPYIVGLHDTVGDDTVVSITPISVTLENNRGELHTVILTKIFKKSPST